MASQCFNRLKGNFAIVVDAIAIRRFRFGRQAESLMEVSRGTEVFVEVVVLDVAALLVSQPSGNAVRAHGIDHNDLAEWSPSVAVRQGVDQGDHFIVIAKGRNREANVV